MIIWIFTTLMRRLGRRPSNFFSSIIPYYNYTPSDETEEKNTFPYNINTAALTSIISNANSSLPTFGQEANKQRSIAAGIANGLTVKQSLAAAMKEYAFSMFRFMELPSSPELIPIALSKLGEKIS
ncbi:hypothetical protein ABK905_05065 [Acerihabitans sp. KWT182]|uniref:Uncharacterized protein n=1 Tax=Acerihabitans sp. KWT182 TaxID=3157919 RepID=A0AAU7QCC5_9GAMM